MNQTEHPPQDIIKFMSGIGIKGGAISATQYVFMCT